MSSLLHVSSSEVNPLSSSGLSLRRRLKSIEKLWESVLRSECGQEMVDLLQQMRAISSPEGQVQDLPQSSVPQLIQKLPIEDAIQAARAFALYFQLINIVEKYYEQQEQKSSRQKVKVESDSYSNGNAKKIATEQLKAAVVPGADGLEEIWLEQNNKIPQAETFQWLFPHLKAINMPPRVIQRLLTQLDIRLVFTAHPTEIVRHTIRKKQRRVSEFLRKLDLSEDEQSEMDSANSWETEEITNQLMEEIRLWWRTDELHQFKPKVIDEVDYALHYFQEVLFDVLPQLAHRLKQSLKVSFPNLEVPSNKFCYFGSWVGADRDGNPFVTPDVTWETACYQRGIVLDKYLKSVEQLRELLSLSLHLSNVLPELLDSLEQDRQQMPEIYEHLAMRYRQEPYRLKIAYIEEKLKNTRERNQILKDHSGKPPSDNVYHNEKDFLKDLTLIQASLAATNLTCRELDNIICQVEVFGFILTQLDFRQESSRHSDAIAEIADYLGVLPKSYNELTETEKTAWLVKELQTRRPLIPAEMPFSDKTTEIIETFLYHQHD